MPPHTNRIAPVEKPIRHLIRTAPPPVRNHLLRLHVFESRLFEILLDQFGNRPFRVRDQGSFEARMHFQAGVGLGNRDARVFRIDPGVEG